MSASHEHTSFRTSIHAKPSAGNPKIYDIEIYKLKEQREFPGGEEALRHAYGQNPDGIELTTLQLPKDAYETAMQTGQAVASVLQDSGQLLPEYASHPGDNVASAVAQALITLASHGVHIRQFEQGHPGFAPLVDAAAQHQAEPNNVLEHHLETVLKAHDQHHNVVTPSGRGDDWGDKIKAEAHKSAPGALSV